MNLPKLTFSFALLAPSLLFCQESTNPFDNALVTDRPDATEASSTVGAGVLQLETGGFYTSFEENDFKTEIFTYNTSIIRYGIFNNFELRVGWNFQETRFTTNGMELPNVLSGVSPLLVGMKTEITKEKGWIPEIALIGHLFLPLSASTDYRPESTGADFRFSLSHTLNERSSIAYNVGGAWGRDTAEVAYIYTLAYSYSVTRRFGFYVEVYGDFPEDASANHLWDVGATYLLSPDFQLDATLGRSFTKGQDILLSTGFSYRILK